MISEIGRRMARSRPASTTQKYVEKHWKEGGGRKKRRGKEEEGGVAEGTI